MSNIDWIRPLEACHEDGRVVPVEASKIQFCGNRMNIEPALDDGDIFTFMLNGSHYDEEVKWRIRNKAEPKADIPDWAIKLTAKLSGYGDGLDGLSIPELMKFGSDMQMAFAKYVAEHGKDPDNEEALCVVRAMRDDDFSIGSMADGLCVEAALRGIKRGRKLERGEVK